MGRVSRAMRRLYCDRELVRHYKKAARLAFAPASDESIEYYYGMHLAFRHYMSKYAELAADSKCIHRISFSIGYNVALIAGKVADPPRKYHRLELNVEKNAAKFAGKNRGIVLEPENIDVLRGKIFCYTMLYEIAEATQFVYTSPEYIKAALRQSCYHLMQIINGKISNARATLTREFLWDRDFACFCDHTRRHDYTPKK